EPILVVVPNSAWYPVLFLGAALKGCPLSGINHELWCSALGRKCCEFPGVMMLPRDLPPWEDTLPDLFRDIQHEPDDTLLLPFSSGTGGKPRCVELTHRNYKPCLTSLSWRVDAGQSLCCHFIMPQDFGHFFIAFLKDVTVS
ncbi:hypothetical protein OSTOST_09981, partial [Ostertagia ostertagi]